MAAYYNEVDSFAAAWLRELIKVDHIAPGEVDERSIAEVAPEDLRGFTQCHFFAGIGVWSYALRAAGWPDDSPVWTGSCPCQSFSASGKRGGFSDQRHLWPAWFRLIRECRPDTVFGEQVASKDGLAWFDLVSSDLEGEGYAVGAADTCVAGFGAPHIRQRLYFVADAHLSGREPITGHDIGTAPARDGAQGRRCPSELCDADGSVADTDTAGWRGWGAGETGAESRAVERLERLRPTGELGHTRESGLQIGQRLGGVPPGTVGVHTRQAAECPGIAGRTVGDPEREQLRTEGQGRTAETSGPMQRADRERQRLRADAGQPSGLANGFWRDAQWLWCRDGKYRPVEPLFKQMADGSAESLGSVRPDAIQKITEEILNAYPTEDDAREAVFALREAYQQKAIRGWKAGGLHGVYEAPILLTFLLQLTQQGWSLSEGIPRSGKKAAREMLRSVREYEATSCPSCGRGLDEQRPDECADAMHLLSSILARNAQEAWAEALNSDASFIHPLARGIVNRVGRLRGYGNALNAQQAKAFIESYIEVSQKP